METLSFDEYEALLRKAGVRRSTGGSLVFHQPADDAASDEGFGLGTADAARCVQGAQAQSNCAGALTVAVRSRSDFSEVDLPLPSAPPVAPYPRATRARARGAVSGDDDDEVGAAFAWEADLELIAGEVDHHANALKGAVLVRAVAWAARARACCAR